MLKPISNSVISSYPVVQKIPTAPLLSLPIEIQEAIEKYLDSTAQQALFKALTTETRNGEPINSPTLKLHLIQQRVAPQYQRAVANSDANLRAFVLNQLESLWSSGQLDQVVERPMLFKLLLHVNDDPKISKFLGQKIHQQYRELIQTLLNWVERSKTEEVQTVAANALTLLVKTGLALKKRDFKGIRVPGADLSDGKFHYTQFEGADLSNVNFSGANLEHVNLQKANLAGVNFGELPYINVGTSVATCCYSPNGRWVAVGTRHGEIKLYQIETFKLVQSLTGHASDVTSVKFSPSGELLAAGDLAATVKLWRVESGEELFTLAGHSNGTVEVDFSPSGKLLATGGGDVAVKLWRVSDGVVLYTLIGHRDRVIEVKFSPSGEWLASASVDRTLKLWRVESGEEVRTFSGHYNGISSMDFSPSGEWLASGGGDGTVKLWRVSDGTVLHTLVGHKSWVPSVKFSPSGEWLASGSGDGTLRLWRVESGEESYTVARERVVDNMDFSPSGDLLASSYGLMVNLFKLDNLDGLYGNRSRKPLNMHNLRIQDAHGLSLMDKILLKQKDVHGEPALGPVNKQSDQV